MQPVSPGARRYDAATIFFHWATAALVVFQWVGAHAIDMFPPGAGQMNARSVHITSGALLTVLLVARLSWRATYGRRLPLADAGLLNLLAKGTHWTLYALLVTAVLAGMGLAWTRGDSLFGLLSIPAYDPGNVALAYRVREVHDAIASLILTLAAVHAAAALLHRYRWHDGVLDRMLPRR